MKDQWLQRLPDKELPSWMQGTTTGFRTRSGLLAFMSEDVLDGKKSVHISVSHKDRLPTYHEMKRIRYEIAPEVPYMAMIFPPESEFRNVCETCLHLFQIDPSEMESAYRMMAV